MKVAGILHPSSTPTSISSIEHLFFSFSSCFFIYQLDSSVFWSFWTLYSLESSVTGHFSSLFWSFCALCFFGCCECWLLMIRLSFHVGKQWSLSVASWPWGELITVYKTEFTPWETMITFTSLFICPLTSAIIVFSKAHCMSWFHTRSFRWQ